MKITTKIKGVENIRKEADKVLADEIKKLKSKPNQPASGKVKTALTVDSSLKVSSTPKISPSGVLQKKQ